MNSSPSARKAASAATFTKSQPGREVAPANALARIPGIAKRSADGNTKAAKQMRKEDPMVIRPTTRFCDIGGQERTILEIGRLVEHLRYPEIFQTLGVSAPRGILLLGPPGSGKSHLAHCIAGEMDIPMLKIAAPEIVSGISGESEERLRDLFKKAEVYAPCILFIDEIDAITQKRDSTSKDMEKRIVAQLLSCLDDLNTRTISQIFLIGATNDPDSMDPALRRAGRFDREVSLGVPNKDSRLLILEVVTKGLKLSPDVDLKELARKTPGFVGADLKSLISEAAREAANRFFDRLANQSLPSSERKSMENCTVDTDKDGTAKIVHPETNVGTSSLLSFCCSYTSSFVKEWSQNGSIEMSDFHTALERVQPSAKREGFATIPDVSWDDVGALAAIRQELQSAIVEPVRNPEVYERFGLQNPSGILLCGPPGCGKTLLAKGVANESGINFISVEGPELLNKYVGESEKSVRKVFQRARDSAPCVIFFDEIDALCPRRSDSGDNNATSRVVNQLLTELDGMEPRKQVFVIGATNRPDILDPAVLRPGRLDKMLFVDVPDLAARTDILRTITKDRTKPPMDTDIVFEDIAHMTERFSGADLAALVREAASLLIRQQLSLQRQENRGMKIAPEVLDSLRVKKCHIEEALKKVKPSVTPEVYHSYLALKERLSHT